MFPVSDVIPPRTRPVVTVGLIAANALVFLYQSMLDRGGIAALVQDAGVVPAGLAWSTLLTAPFLHDGWIPLGANLVSLWIFGENVEDAMGHAPYLGFYLFSAAASALVYAVVHPGSTLPLVGAGGAVAAVTGAYLVLYPGSQVLTAMVRGLHLDVVEVPAILFAGLWLLLQALGSAASPGEAIAGGLGFVSHLAGFAAGALAGLVLRRRSRRWD